MITVCKCIIFSWLIFSGKEFLLKVLVGDNYWNLYSKNSYKSGCKIYLDFNKEDLINFPENKPGTRNSFSCGQSKQACSLYHSNYQVRLDKTGIVLNYGQSPLVRSRYT